MSLLIKNERKMFINIEFYARMIDENFLEEILFPLCQDLRWLIRDYICSPDKRMIFDFLDVITDQIIGLINMVKDFRDYKKNKWFEFNSIDSKSLREILVSFLDKEIQSQIEHFKIGPKNQIQLLTNFIIKTIKEEILDYTQVEFSSDQMSNNGLPLSWTKRLIEICFLFFQYYFHVLERKIFFNYSDELFSEMSILNYIKSHLPSLDLTQGKYIFCTFENHLQPIRCGKIKEIEKKCVRFEMIVCSHKQGRLIPLSEEDRILARKNETPLTGFTLTQEKLDTIQ